MVFGPTDKSLAPIHSRNVNLVKDKTGILSTWAEHFSDFLNQINPTVAVPQPDVVKELDLPPTQS